MSDEIEDLGGDVDTFSAEEQAQFEALRSETPSEPVEGDKPAEATADAPEGEKPAEKAPEAAEKADKPKDPMHQAMHEEREKRKTLPKGA
jgi:hypothetical protein